MRDELLKITGELDRLSGAEQAPDREIAYRCVDHKELARQMNFQPVDGEKLLNTARELAEISRNGTPEISDGLRRKILSDPKKARKAKDIGFNFD